MGSINAQGAYVYTEDDSAALVSDLLNKQSFAISQKLTALDTALARLPRAVVVGTVTASIPASTPGVTMYVAFPAGKFTLAPHVQVTRASASVAKYVPYVTAVTKDGFTLGLYSGDGTSPGTLQTTPVNWTATQP